MPSKRVCLSIDEQAAALLDKVGVRGRYLSDVVTQRWRTCQHALAWLHEEGWELDAVRDCVMALGGCWELGLGGGDVAPCMRALETVATPNGLDDRTCRALCAVAAEWWSYNAELRRELGGASRRVATKAGAGRKPLPQPVPA